MGIEDTLTRGWGESGTGLESPEFRVCHLWRELLDREIRLLFYIHRLFHDYLGMSSTELNTALAMTSAKVTGPQKPRTVRWTETGNMPPWNAAIRAHFMNPYLKLLMNQLKTGARSDHVVRKRQQGKEDIRRLCRMLCLQELGTSPLYFWNERSAGKKPGNLIWANTIRINCGIPRAISGDDTGSRRLTSPGVDPEIRMACGKWLTQLYTHRGKRTKKSRGFKEKRKGVLAVPAPSMDPREKFRTASRTEADLAKFCAPIAPPRISKDSLSRKRGTSHSQQSDRAGKSRLASGLTGAEERESVRGKVKDAERGRAISAVPSRSRSPKNKLPQPASVMKMFPKGKDARTASTVRGLQSEMGCLKQKLPEKAMRAQSSKYSSKWKSPSSQSLQDSFKSESASPQSSKYSSKWKSASPQSSKDSSRYKSVSRDSSKTKRRKQDTGKRVKGVRGIKSQDKHKVGIKPRSPSVTGRLMPSCKSADTGKDHLRTTSRGSKGTARSETPKPTAISGTPKPGKESSKKGYMVIVSAHSEINSREETSTLTLEQKAKGLQRPVTKTDHCIEDGEELQVANSIQPLQSSSSISATSQGELKETACLMGSASKDSAKSVGTKESSDLSVPDKDRTKITPAYTGSGKTETSDTSQQKEDGSQVGFKFTEHSEQSKTTMYTDSCTADTVTNVKERAEKTKDRISVICVESSGSTEDELDRISRAGIFLTDSPPESNMDDNSDLSSSSQDVITDSRHTSPNTDMPSPPLRSPGSAADGAEETSPSSNIGTAHRVSTENKHQEIRETASQSEFMEKRQQTRNFRSAKQGRASTSSEPVKKVKRRSGFCSVIKWRRPKPRSGGKGRARGQDEEQDSDVPVKTQFFCWGK